MTFSCARCGSVIGTYRVDVHRISDNEIVESRDYCKKCIKKVFEGDISAAAL